MPLAPVALFAYKRPQETLKVLEHLARCPELDQTEVVIYCDGPRNGSDRGEVSSLRGAIDTQRFVPQARVIRRDENLGLARSIVKGVTELCASHGCAIVLEDDLLVSRGFLAYMNEALSRYRDDARILQVSAHSFPVERAVSRTGRAALLPVTTTWGWGVWARSWALYEDVPRELALLADHRVRRAFDLDGTFPYSRMLEAALSGRVDSWGIRWWWSVFKRGGLVVYPFPTLVRNVGQGETATHTVELGSLGANHWSLDARIESWEESGLVDEPLLRNWKGYLKRAANENQRRAVLSRLLRGMSRLRPHVRN